MTNITPKDWTIGYCTNIHAGIDLASIEQNLDKYSVAARIAAGQDELGVGLWLPARAAGQLVGNAEEFGKFLSDRRLRPFTINGFPYDNFHQDVVKNRVYQPTWAQPERLEYTQQLAEILAVLLPEPESVGSISTLPIGWPTSLGDASPSDLQSCLDHAGKNFRELAEFLRKLESRTGQRIVVAIEPEPGCILDSTDDVIRFFDKHLPDINHRRYVNVCHDVCHTAVMMEGQAEVLTRFSAAGIAIGKVQVSSAVVADWQSMANGRRREAIGQLREFAEDRYLHQTGRRTATGQFVLAEDLPQLIDSISPDGDPVWGDQAWVVHFHVPIFLERFGHLTTSQHEVLECLKVLASPEANIDFTGHLEIETYAWTVLPAAMRKQALADEIASEILWLRRGLVETV